MTLPSKVDSLKVSIASMDLSVQPITIIVPICLLDENIHFQLERLELIFKLVPKEHYQIIVSESNSLVGRSELQGLCDAYNVKVIFNETTTGRFSSGAARNFGAQYASTRFLLFHDVDLLASPEMYDYLAKLVTTLGLKECRYKFLSVPVLYLSQEQTDLYLKALEKGFGFGADAELFGKLLAGDVRSIPLWTACSSALIVDRLHFLGIGGNNSGFVGHGGEDFELVHRLSDYYKLAARPPDYYVDFKKNQINEYRGMRAFFSLYGLELLWRGVALKHLWHPPRQSKVWIGASNMQSLPTVLRDFDAKKYFIPPLVDLSCPSRAERNKTLVLCSPRARVAIENWRHVFPLLGKFYFHGEYDFTTGDDFLGFLDEEGFSRVLFHNPFHNARRLALYTILKRNGLPFLVFERGGYPDSWFFDPRGFNGESSSYEPNYWDHPLQQDEITQTREWIFHLMNSSQTLEKNGVRIGPEAVKNELGIGSRKMIFVALQRPSDTTTMFLAGPCGSQFVFYDWIRNLACKLDPRRYAIVVKKHPLESVIPDLGPVLIARDDCHIHDLILAADKVVVINSGVGLLSVTFGVPTITCGKSYYTHNGLAVQARSPEELLILCQSPLQVDLEKRDRFVHYLVFKFYSFGVAEVETRKEEDGSHRSVTKRIFWRVVRGVTDEEIVFGDIPKPPPGNALLFSTFGSGVSDASRKPPAAPAVKPSEAPAVKPLAAPAVKPATVGVAAAAAGSAKTPLPMVNGKLSENATGEEGGVFSRTSSSKNHIDMRQKTYNSKLSDGKVQLRFFYLFRLYSIVCRLLQSPRLQRKMEEDPIRYFSDARSSLNRVMAKVFVRRLDHA